MPCPTHPSRLAWVLLALIVPTACAEGERPPPPGSDAEVEIQPVEETEEESQDYVLHLKKGWNCAAIRRRPRDSSVTTLFSNYPAVSLLVWQYRDGTYRAVDELLPLRGYWIYASEATDVIIQLP